MVSPATNVPVCVSMSSSISTISVNASRIPIVDTGIAVAPEVVPVIVCPINSSALPAVSVQRIIRLVVQVPSDALSICSFG